MCICPVTQNSELADPDAARDALLPPLPSFFLPVRAGIEHPSSLTSHHFSLVTLYENPTLTSGRNPHTCVKPPSHMCETPYLCEAADLLLPYGCIVLQSEKRGGEAGRYTSVGPASMESTFHK